MPDGKSLEEWAQVQGIEKWDSTGDIGDEIVAKATKKSQILRDRMMATLKGFQSEQAYLYLDNQSYMGRGAALQGMKKHIGSYKRLLKQSKSLHMPSMAGSFDDAIDVTYWEAEIKTMMADLKRRRRLGP
jgi:hypothetical protein